MFYKCLKAFLRLLLLPLFRVKVLGKEQLPKESGYIVYSNHLSNWDPIFMHLILDTKPRFMAKKELFKNPILRGIVTYFGAFSVDRGNGDLGAIKTALTIVRSGGVLGIYPEGTRAKDGVIKPFQPGAAVVALRTDAALVPLYISRKLKPFKRTYMVFGEPTNLKERLQAVSLADKHSVRRAADVMREEILALAEKQVKAL